MSVSAVIGILAVVCAVVIWGVRIMANRGVRLVFLIAFVMIFGISIGAFEYEAYQDSQPSYTANDEGGSYVHAIGTGWFLGAEATLPDFAQGMCPTIGGLSLMNYHINTDSSGQVTDADFTYESADEPLDSFAAYRDLLGDGFTYKTAGADFAPRDTIEGVYEGRDMTVTFYDEKDAGTGRYPIVIDMETSSLVTEIDAPGQ